MKLNFKYYNTGSLILLILVLSAIYVIFEEIISSVINLPDGLQESITTLNGYLGWLSPVAFIGLILFLINEYWWKNWWMNWLVNIPDLNGRYSGELISSYQGEDGKPVMKDCVMEIKQNASSIHICTYYADKGTNVQNSMSYSVAEEVVKEKNGSFTLYYLFTNEPDNMNEALRKHDGTAKFTYLADKRELVGEYYNHRLNKGAMRVRYEGKVLLHRFEK
ncbi:MAG: hypothetical protein H6573_32020 [Lewinellaceae bacterium]|nr:hypothetical protein [Lewinellaceae bacterium]